MIDYDRIGRRIQEERKCILGISQEKMAEALNMHQADISNLERARKGSGITNLDTLERIADFLNLPIENLIFGSSMEAHMVSYYGGKMVLRVKNGKITVTQNQRKLLTRLIGNELEDAALVCYECGPYLIYVFVESQKIYMGEMLDKEHPAAELPKFHFYSFFNDTIIGNMVASPANVFALVNSDWCELLQMVIPQDVIDVLETNVRFNPYFLLSECADSEEEEERLRSQGFCRMYDLRPVWNRAIWFVEKIYVVEDARRKGICRMMIDLLRMLKEDPILWVNMEPTNGDDLENEYEMYPHYTAPETGRVSLNASIAEKLGLVVNADLVYRTVETVDPSGNVALQTRGIHKIACHIPKDIENILQEDESVLPLVESLLQLRSRHMALSEPEEEDLDNGQDK
jgi:transcriptional regulator with XRE-family HTH domain